MLMLLHKGKTKVLSLGILKLCMSMYDHSLDMDKCV